MFRRLRTAQSGLHTRWLVDKLVVPLPLDGTLLLQRRGPVAGVGWLVASLHTACGTGSDTGIGLLEGWR